MTVLLMQSLATVTMATLLLVTTSPAEADVYQNQEFGIAVALPKGLLTCSGVKDPHDHGVAIFLDRNSKSCGELGRYRSISIFASYNVTDDTKTLKDYLRWTCSEVLQGQCAAAPNGLKIDALQSSSGRVNHPDGSVDIVVLTQAGRAPNQPSDSSAFVNYSVRLHTDRAHLSADLRTLNSFLRAVKLTPPG